jgi:hypothetical protein
MKPYTYLLKHRPSGRVYYGVRTANTVPAHEDLWNKYFTSSNTVKQLVEETGLDSFDYEVRREFNTAEQAIAWETKVLRRVCVLEKEQWINANIAGYIIPTDQSRRKISEYHRGKPKSEEHRAKIAAAITGIKREPRDEEYRSKMSAAKSGSGNGMYGRKHSTETLAKISAKRKGVASRVGFTITDEQKQKQREKMLGRIISEEHKKHISEGLKSKGYKRKRKVCEHCNKDVAVNIYSQYHGDRCKSRK